MTPADRRPPDDAPDNPAPTPAPTPDATPVPDHPTSADAEFGSPEVASPSQHETPERPQSSDDDFLSDEQAQDRKGERPGLEPLGIEIPGRGGLEPAEHVKRAYEEHDREKWVGDERGRGADAALPTQADFEDAEAARSAARDQLHQLEAEGNVLGGDPIERLDHWHPQGWNDQGYEGTCGLVAVEGTALNADVPTTENDVVDLARTNGLCETGGEPYENGATYPTERQALLQELGLDSTIERNQTPEQLAQMVERGDGVIARVNSGQLWGADDPFDVGSTGPAGEYWPDHAVAVTGTVRNEGQLEGFVVNDSGIDDGAGVGVPIDRWKAAWADVGGDRELNVVRAENRRDAR